MIGFTSSAGLGPGITPGCDNGRMSTPDEPAEQREVLSSLPRSRRQRPSARREAARAGRAPKAKPEAVKTATKAKPRAAAKPRATAAAKPRPRKSAPKPRSAIPPAGYATPSEHRGHGSADPGAALAGCVRGVLKRLPF